MNRHYLIFICLICTAAIGMLFVPPIAQDINYHHFADQRELWGIANFGDVMSNLPFVLVGIAGLILTRNAAIPGGLSPLIAHYRVFFIGVLLTGFGSGYYHLQPNNFTLVWDRLPMTIAFMAFFSALVGEFISIKAARLLLWPLIFLGFVSVIYWHLSEQAGRGDLRPYVLVQFLPILLTPYILLAFPSPFSRTDYLWYLVIFYLLAKLLESGDQIFFNWGEYVSGHSLKHVSAALATYWMYRALRYRQLARTNEKNEGTYQIIEQPQNQ
jgi:hypothetical protein